VPQVELHELLCAFDGFLFGLQIENSETADDLFGFGERAVSRGEFIAGDADGGTGGYWSKASIGDHRAGFDGRFALFVDCVDECLGRRVLTSIMNRMVFPPILVFGRAWLNLSQRAD
jgi:hypothetical protein